MSAPYDLGLEATPPVTTPPPPLTRPTRSGLRIPRAVLLVGLTLGVCVDALFYDKPLGLSVPLLALLVGASLTGLSGGEGVRAKTKTALLVGLPLLFFAVMTAVRANAFLTAANVAACLLLGALALHFYAAGLPGALGLSGLIAIPARAAGNALWRTAPLLFDSMDVKAAVGGRRLLPLVRGLLLALPVLLVFGALLASADLVFARYVEQLERLELPPGAEILAGRLVNVLVAAWLLAGGLAYALWRGKAGEAPPPPAVAPHPAGRLGFTEAMIVLGSVVVLFGLFVAVQFAYLFGGSANVVSREGFTYAEYVHRGFGELVTVAALTLALLLGLHRATRRESVTAARAFNVAGTLLVALTLVLLASALQRLLLYEDAYGFTETRLQVHVFLVWIGVLLVAVAGALWRNVRRGFALGGLVAALGFVATLNVLNPDATVARQNLARYGATGKIDVACLAGLSDDAVPLLVRAAPSVRAVAPAGYDDGSGESRPLFTLADELARRRQAMKLDVRWRAWPAFHFARAAAWRALAGE